MGFNVWCPLCGGVVTAWGWRSDIKVGAQRGVCANCYERVTVTVVPDNPPSGTINRDAPFYPLVELIDEAGCSTEPAHLSTGDSQRELGTID